MQRLATLYCSSTCQQDIDHDVPESITATARKTRTNSSNPVQNVSQALSMGASAYDYLTAFGEDSNTQAMPVTQPLEVEMRES